MPVSATTTTPSVSPFSDITESWLRSAPLARRKALGQFMTPRGVRDSLLRDLPLWPGIRVLDPGVGTGEFLRSVLDREPAAELHGWDTAPEMIAAANQLVPEATLQLRSALDPYLGEPFDLVIGNPPYFQFRAAPEVRRHFAQVISGRPNIFALFFQAGLDALTPNGTLAYVVPPSMNNGSYFEALRRYIVSLGSVSRLTVIRDSSLFADANTAVQLLTIRLGDTHQPHVYRRDCMSSGFRRTILAEHPHLLEHEFHNRTTLWEAGFRALTGTIIWNQRRDSLRSNPTPSAARLIWAENIRRGELDFDSVRSKRLPFVVTDRVLHGPAVVTNRIVGAVGRGELRSAVIPAGMPFVGENHVNVVVPRGDAEPRFTWEQLNARLLDPQIAHRVNLLTGNTQISATELTHLIPVDN